MSNQKRLEFQIGITRSNGNRILIEVIDRESRVRVFTGSMSLEDWAMASTGLSGMPIVVDGYLTPEQAKVLGSRKIIQRVTCPKVSMGTDGQRAAVLSDFHTHHANRGWKLQTDGTTRQQPGQQHEYIIYKHEAPTDE